VELQDLGRADATGRGHLQVLRKRECGLTETGRSIQPASVRWAEITGNWPLKTTRRLRGRILADFDAKSWKSRRQRDSQMCMSRLLFKLSLESIMLERRSVCHPVSHCIAPSARGHTCMKRPLGFADDVLRLGAPYSAKSAWHTRAGRNATSLGYPCRGTGMHAAASGGPANRSTRLPPRECNFSAHAFAVDALPSTDVVVVRVMAAGRIARSSCPWLQLRALSGESLFADGPSR